MRAAVEGALACTHVHPEAVDGAVIMAQAVAWLACQPLPAQLAEPHADDAGTGAVQASSAAQRRQQLLSQLLAVLIPHAQTELMKSRLNMLQNHVSLAVETPLAA
jgi:ADP-ribosylglycohydrolase